MSGLSTQSEIADALAEAGAATITGAGGVSTQVTLITSGGDTVGAGDVINGVRLRYTAPGAADVVVDVAISITVDAAAVANITPVANDDMGLAFGALTPVGMGGVPTTAPDGPYGEFTVASGMLTGNVSPLTGNGTVDGQTVTVVPDKASARVDELKVVYESLPVATARGLLLRDGAVSSSTRVRLAPREFVNEMTMEPHDWTENADPRLSTRNVRLSGISFGGSANLSAATENVTVQGIEFQMEAGGLLPAEMNVTGTERESEGSIGIVLVENPSRNMVIRQNEIWSRTTADIVTAGDYSAHTTTTRQIRGITSKRNNAHNSGINYAMQIEENYIHDVSRGASVVAMYAENGVRSRFCRNVIMDVYTNFGTVGYSNGVDIFDNKGKGVLAAGPETDGFVGTSGDGPHAGIFGFDAGPSRSTQNISFMGNVFSAGANTREALEIAAGNTTPRLYKCTGVKFNDPEVPDSYWNIVAGFNMINTRGIAFEISGAGADEHILVFHNTFASNPDPQGGSNPIMLFTGAKNMRMWKNIACGYRINLQEDDAVGRTLDTLQGYGNIQINRGAGDYGETDYFVGLDGSSGVTTGIPVEHLFDAYLPKPDTGAILNSGEVAGAVGTSLYSGNGVHSAVYAPLVSTANDANNVGAIICDGSQTGRWTGGQGGMIPVSPNRVFLSMWVKRNVDQERQILWSQRGNGIQIGLWNNALWVTGSDGTNAIFDMISTKRLPDDGQFHHYTLGYIDGRCVVTLDGEVDPMKDFNVYARGNLGLRTNTVTMFRPYIDNASHRFNASIKHLYIEGEFRDMEDQTQYAAVHNADGSPRPLGADGSGWFGVQPPVYHYGDASRFLSNAGTGPNMPSTGAVIVTDPS